jgi:hypothetical protein
VSDVPEACANIAKEWIGASSATLSASRKKSPCEFVCESNRNSRVGAGFSKYYATRARLQPVHIDCGSLVFNCIQPQRGQGSSAKLVCEKNDRILPQSYILATIVDKIPSMLRFVVAALLGN